jgi:regulator of sigma E protease
MNAALAAIAVSLLIVVHELGHFIAAKAVGMRVEVFSVGFWKKIAGFRIGETEYRLSLVPLGGYVRVSGESPEEGKGKPYEFWSKTPGQRALFVLGGVTMNFMLALVLFITAFAMGVPFTVADVGKTASGEPAWLAGLKSGDRIVAVDDVERPTFVDLTRQVALSGRSELTLKVQRDGHLLTFRVRPQYDDEAGLKVIGVYPPLEPVVSELAKIGGEAGVSPAQQAGIELGDRILAINGVKVETAYDLTDQLINYPHNEVELQVERDGRTFTVHATSEPVPRPMIGISGLSTTIESLEGDGMARQAGLRVGDRVTAVNGKPAASAVEIEEILRKSLGAADLEALRDERPMAFHASIPDLLTEYKFMSSVEFESSTTLTWVQKDGPAWQVGMRPGDRIETIGGREVETWLDVLTEGERAGGKPHQIQWARGNEILTANVEPVEDTSMSVGHLGIVFRLDRTAPERYGPLGAIRKGLRSTVQTITEILLMFRGFATRQVSPRQMGGILTIAAASYYAAQEGIAKLLYLTAVISAAIAFLNALPIPVLDGGHLLFLAIEKVRGRRLSERTLTVAQTIGFVLIVLLFLYVTRNDILRFFAHG